VAEVFLVFPLHITHLVSTQLVVLALYVLPVFLNVYTNIIFCPLHSLLFYAHSFCFVLYTNIPLGSVSSLFQVAAFQPELYMHLLSPH
jgi:hypothetical protein